MVPCSVEAGILIMVVMKGFSACRVSGIISAGVAALLSICVGIQLDDYKGACNNLPGADSAGCSQRFVRYPYHPYCAGQ